MFRTRLLRSKNAIVEFNRMQNLNDQNKAIKIKPGYCKAKIFQALYNNSQPTGMGFLNHVEGDIDIKTSWKILKENGYYLDYINGRGMKLDFRVLDKDRVLYSRRYDDRQQGPGTMLKRLENMYITQEKCYNCKDCEGIKDKAIE